MHCFRNPTYPGTLTEGQGIRCKIYMLSQVMLDMQNTCFWGLSVCQTLHSGWVGEYGACRYGSEITWRKLGDSCRSLSFFSRVAQSSSMTPSGCTSCIILRTSKLLFSETWAVPIT